MNKSTAEIRQAFLDYFHSKQHKIVASSSLVPANDPTLLFTNAGMNQFKDIFLGLEENSYTRAASSQRCVRAGGKHNDLENVGYTARHHTFFEMLGNFSFGDYFKREAIHYAWEFLTGAEWLNLAAEKLTITVYKDDDEAYKIWADEIKIPTERIIRIGDNKGAAFASDNFWQMGDTGPCGPCTEIFYDHGEQIWGGPPGSAEEEGDRYIEIWNIVFMQFNRQADGTMLPLPKPSVDTGMGLERIAAVLQQVHSNYEIDIFKELIDKIAKLLGCSDLKHHSLRVIADHIRASAFLVADGVTPSNEGRGYVLRRIIRRALRHGHLLGAKESFFYKLVSPLIKVMGSAAETLKAQRVNVEQVIKREEEQFMYTLERGLHLLENALADVNNNKGVLDGEVVFRLYDTYGFPLDLTADICRERNIEIDRERFEQLMEEQRQRARKSSRFTADYNNTVRTDKKSSFIGYDSLQSVANITAIFKADGTITDVLHAGEKGIVFLSDTPFYAESGGQVGDTGILSSSQAIFEVQDTQNITQSIGHYGVLTKGTLKINDELKTIVAVERRQRICLNHTATHLLHAALRKIIGEHVMQKGSLVNENHLRFDFSHSEPLSSSQIFAIEQLVNLQIRRNFPVRIKMMDIDDAKAYGAMALFGEKYDNIVRVLEIGDFSVELCGGTHVERTGDIGFFHVISESGIAAGVRRIEAMTGQCALDSIHQQSQLLYTIATVVKGDLNNLDEKVRSVIEHNKLLEKELSHLKEQQAINISAALMKEVITCKEIKVLVSQLEDADPKILRRIVDDLKNQLGSGIIVLATVHDGKVSLIAGVTRDLTDRIKANELITSAAQCVGGKGGGRPDMAQAGGNDIDALPQALSSVQNWIMEKL